MSWIQCKQKALQLQNKYLFNFLLPFLTSNEMTLDSTAANNKSHSWQHNWLKWKNCSLFHETTKRKSKFSMQIISIECSSKVSYKWWIFLFITSLTCNSNVQSNTRSLTWLHIMITICKQRIFLHFGYSYDMSSLFLP